MLGRMSIEEEQAAGIIRKEVSMVFYSFKSRENSCIQIRVDELPVSMGMEVCRTHLVGKDGPLD